jgi:hypothetical protein
MSASQFRLKRNMGFIDMGNLCFEESISTMPSLFPCLFLKKRCDETIGKLNLLHSFAKRNKHALVLTTKKSLSYSLQQGWPFHILSIPQDKNNRYWKEHVRKHVMFCIEYETPGGKDQSGDVLGQNGNTIEFFNALGIKEWVVCGYVFNKSVESAVRCLLSGGFWVINITDIAEDTGKNVPPVTGDGAQAMTCDQFLHYYLGTCADTAKKRPVGLHVNHSLAHYA